MAQNMELKARLHNLREVRARLRSSATSGPWILWQRDTYFRCQQGRLKLREHPDSAELIWYDRVNAVAVRPSNYFLTPIMDPLAAKQLLTGALGVETMVEKSRELWWYHNVRIHLDQVQRLGDFIEFEGIVDEVNSARGAADRVRWLIEQLGLSRQSWLDRSYRELMLECGR